MEVSRLIPKQACVCFLTAQVQPCRIFSSAKCPFFVLPLNPPPPALLPLTLLFHFLHDKEIFSCAALFIFFHVLPQQHAAPQRAGTPSWDNKQEKGCNDPWRDPPRCFFFILFSSFHPLRKEVRCQRSHVTE